MLGSKVVSAFQSKEPVELVVVAVGFVESAAEVGDVVAPGEVGSLLLEPMGVALTLGK